MQNLKQTTSVQVNIRNDLEKQTLAELLIVPLSNGGRLRIAVKSFAICLGVAILCIFIPVFHFVLVPGAIIIGLFLFYRTWMFHELLLGGHIVCPGCNHEFPAKPAGFNWPKRETCSRCGLELTLNNQNLEN